MVVVVGAVIFGTGVTIYASQPENQRNFSQAVNGATDAVVDTVRGWFGDADDGRTVGTIPGTVPAAAPSAAPVQLSQRGKGNVRHTDFEGMTDAQVEAIAHSPNDPKRAKTASAPKATEAAQFGANSSRLHNRNGNQAQDTVQAE